MDADDFDKLAALPTEDFRGGNPCLIGDDRELGGLWACTEPAGEPGRVVARLEVPALELLVPTAAGAADGGALFRRNVEIGSVHGTSRHWCGHSALPEGLPTGFTRAGVSGAAGTRRQAAAPAWAAGGSAATVLSWVATEGVGVVRDAGSGPRRPATEGECLTVRHTRFQSEAEASFRNPQRSGSCSISEAMTAGSILTCWLVVWVGSHSLGLRDRDWVVCRTSRCPMSLDANSDVPPRSLAEHRRMNVLPQFSTRVSAVSRPYVPDT